ncbi:hypothetical protein [Paraburkholderia aspalathi]|uniref:hypothetical protein n=1 Tax=Paraburkholderia aspalathi TaxID=1324617 RepID=UPI001B2DE033|nr:hypothetical protein [Paraburkholderia aspalathi]CAE6842825.1 hypothetical protein R20943_07198 [Paraburkholderia aspalathi]
MPTLRYFHELSSEQRDEARSLTAMSTPEAQCYVVGSTGQIIRAVELKPLFATGELAAGELVRAQLASVGRSEIEFALRHATGDWSEMTLDEQARNLIAIEQGGAVVSRFALRANHNVYVLTNPQRSNTTILPGLPRPSDFE